MATTVQVTKRLWLWEIKYGYGMGKATHGYTQQKHKNENYKSGM